MHDTRHSERAIILPGVVLVLGSLACSASGLGIVQPTPTLFILPTWVPTIVPSEPILASPTDGPADARTPSLNAETTSTVVGDTDAGALPTLTGDPAAFPDVCALYTQNEIESLFAEPVSGKDSWEQGGLNEGVEGFVCAYDTTTTTVIIVLFRHEDGQAPTPLLQDGQEGEESEMIAVKGLGEEAVYLLARNSTYLTARQGLYMVFVRLIHRNVTNFPADETRLQLAKTIMLTALSRLPQ